MLTRLLRGALESKLEYGRPSAARADLHLPRDDQDRRREPGQPLPRRLARREVRLPDLGHPRRREVDQLQPLLRRRLRRRRARAPAPRCTRSRCTSSPTASFEVIISQREHPGNWLRSEADTRSLAHPPDVPRQAPPGARRAAHRAHRRRRRAARAADARGALPLAALRRLLREGRRRASARSGRPARRSGPTCSPTRPRLTRDRQVQGPADQVAPGATSTWPTTRRSSSRSRRPSASTG